MINNLASALNSAIRSMQTAQFALSTHSRNIAHANDPTYTRRTVDNRAIDDIGAPTIIRIRNQFVDQQYRMASGGQGEAGARRDVLNRVEEIFGDPVSGGLGNTLTRFFDAWKGLSENPTDEISRLQVLSDSRTFVQQTRQAYGNLSELELKIGDQVAGHVEEVNGALRQVFELNKRIAEAARNNISDADYRDQRDALLDKLSTLTGATYQDQKDGGVRITVGSTLVLDQLTVVPLKMGTSAQGPAPFWGQEGAVPYQGGGTIGGLLSVRQSDVSKLKSDIANLAFTVATEVNKLHGPTVADPTVKPFFLINGTTDAAGKPIPTADIRVNPDLGPVDVIPGFASDEPSAGDRAKAIADLGDSPVMQSLMLPGEKQSPMAYFRNLIGLIGTRTAEAQTTEEIAQAHVQASQRQRDSESGVSLDEEMASLMLQQRAFQAATRVITVTDEMLEYLIVSTSR